MIGPGGGPAPEHLAEIKRKVEELEKKIAASDAEYSRRIQFANTADHILNITRDYLKRLPEHAVLEPVEPARLTNHDHRKLLDLVRRDISEAQSPCRYPPLRVPFGPPPRAPWKRQTLQPVTAGARHRPHGAAVEGDGRRLTAARKSLRNAEHLSRRRRTDTQRR